MSDQFLSNIQSALLFDRRNSVNLEKVVQKFLEIEMAKSGTRYNLVERNGNIFFRMYGTNNVMITVEYLDSAAQLSVFGDTLRSHFTNFTVPNAVELLKKHKSHVLINVHHGAIPQSDAISKLMKQIKLNPEGHSLAHFEARLQLCGMLSSLVHDFGTASLVHWTQSNELLTSAMFEILALDAAPTVLHVHPRLIQGEKTREGQLQVELITFGAAHFIGREIKVKSSPVPWIALYQTAITFMRIALTKNGYIIPDGDTFGTDDDTISCRVKHIPGKNTGEAETPALYELEVLLSKEHNFVSPDYVPKENVINHRSPPRDIVNPDSPAGQKLMQDWKQKSQMAQGMGGSFEVRAVEKPQDEPPSRGLFGVRKIFGRRH